MVVKPKPTSVRTKRGDDFRLQMAVRDRLSEDVLIAYTAYEIAYENWRDAVNADIPDSIDIAEKLLIKDTASDTYEALSVVDITNWQIKCAIAWGGKIYGNGEVIIEDVVNGIFTVYISKEITYWLKPREYLFELKFTYPDGDVITSTDMVFIVDQNIVDSEEFTNENPYPVIEVGPYGPTGPTGPQGAPSIPNFSSVDELVNNFTLGYTVGQGITVVTPGTVISVAEYHVKVAVLGSAINSGYHISTANGVLLIALPVPGMGLPAAVFGVSKDNNAVDNTIAYQACINALSYSESIEIIFPEGWIDYTEVYYFYDATLNPEFFNGSPTRHGRVHIEGSGALSIAQIRNINATPVEYGTILNATGDGQVVSRTSLGHGTSPYPARKFMASNITLISNKAAQYVIEASSCPEMELNSCALIQRHSAGHGVMAKSAWFFDAEDCFLINISSSTPTGDGIVGGTDIEAGLWTWTGGLIDGFRDLVTWSGGTWAGMTFKNCALQAATRYGFNISGGTIRILEIDGCHFEGISRVSDIKASGGTIRHLRFSGNYILAGSNLGVSYTSGPIIDLAIVESVDVSNNEIFRPAQTFLNITATSNGLLVGEASNNAFPHDGTLPAGPVYLFTGILPSLEDNVWTGMGSGVYALTALRLFDVTTIKPTILREKGGGNFLIDRLTIGEPDILTGIIAGVTLNNTSSSTQDITTAAVGPFAVNLPTASTVLEGRFFVIKNNAASLGNITVKISGGPTLKTLTPGIGAICVFSKALNSYVVI